MTLFEKIKQYILNVVGVQRRTENPNNERFTFLGNEDTIKRKKVEECKWWYYGDSNELLNFYTAEQTYGTNENPIYNRNKRQYFWGLSAEEMGFKRIHSGVPNAMVSTIVNLVGTGQITSEKYQPIIDEIKKRVGWKNLINQKQMPLTLALGWGAFKPVIDLKIDKEYPLLEWYNADDVDFVKKHDRIIAIIYKDYYTYNKQDYVLCDIRRVVDGTSKIEYKLFKLGKSNEVNEVPKDTIPDLADLQDIEIEGYNRILGVPSVYFYDVNNESGGRSIFMGKIDLFDDLDQDLSQASQTSRVSTPVEYYPVDLMQRGKNGEATLPKIYNRQFLASDSYPNGDGELSGEIKTTQPQLNFDQYSNKILSDLDLILSGILSPATFGLNVARNDNGLAQREKEKVSIMTRDNIIDRQEQIERELMEIMLDLKQYIGTNGISKEDYGISVKFDEYATPSFESVSSYLVNLLTSGAITPEMFVNKLYGDALAEEDKLREIEYIKTKQEQDTLDDSEFLGGINENGITKDRNVGYESENGIPDIE